MDLGYFRRGKRGFADRSAAALDYGVLVATLAAVQSTSATARAEALSADGGATGTGHDPLVEILLGQPGWREAVAAQGGCFARAEVPSREAAVNPDDRAVYHRISAFLQRPAAKA